MTQFGISEIVSKDFSHVNYSMESSSIDETFYSIDFHTFFIRKWKWETFTYNFAAVLFVLLTSVTYYVRLKWNFYDHTN